MLNIKNAVFAITLLLGGFSGISWAELAESVNSVGEPGLMADKAAAEKSAPGKSMSAKASDSSGIDGAIDINTADAKQLTLLSNIGLKKAQQIIDYRALHGQFTSIDELQKVKGIGKSTIEKNRSRMMVAVQ